MTDQIPDVATQRAFNQTVVDEFVPTTANSAVHSKVKTCCC